MHSDTDTDGHVDNLCFFVRPGLVALTWTDDKALLFASVVNQCDDLRQKKKIRGCEKFIPNSQKLCTNSRNVGVVFGALFGPHSTKDVISIF